MKINLQLYKYSTVRGMVRLGVSFTLLKWFNPRKIVRGEKAVRDLLPFTVVGKK